MSKARTKALIAVQTIIVALFVVAVLLGMGATNANADTLINGVSEQTAASYVDGLYVNGHVPNAYDAKEIYKNDNSTPLRSEGDIQSFLKGEKTVETWNGASWITSSTKATIGYLEISGDSIDFSWGGAMTNQFMASGLTFDGNGKKINLTASALNSSPWVSISNLGDAGANVFITANKGSHSDVDLNGAFIGYIPANSKIINTNFVYNKQIGETEQKTDGSGCGGFVAAYCNGTIQNCSVTVKNGAYFKIKKTSTRSSGFLGNQYEFMARNSYAFGGFVGILAGGRAMVVNSKIDLEANSLLYVNTIAAHGGTYKGHGRVFLGGVAGWMGGNSMAYNLYTAGSGTLEGTCAGGSDNTSLAPVGIAVGCNTKTSNFNSDSGNLISGTDTTGTINGVINTWTGAAKSYYNEGQYSPVNKSGAQTTYGTVVGMSGDQSSGAETASNIYVTEDLYSQSDWYSIGHSYNGKNGSTYNPKKTANLITLESRSNANSNYSKTDSQYAYLAWDNSTLATTNTESIAASAILAVYDISNDPDHILWANQITRISADGTRSEESDSYYWRNETIKQAHDTYDVTYTSFTRNGYPRVEVKYEFGKAAYIQKVINNQVVDSASGVKDLGKKQYGDGYLDVPQIKLYNKPISDNTKTEIRNPITDTSYWQTLKVGENSLTSATGYKEVGIYETFIYLPQTSIVGVNYNNIHLLDTNEYIVAYIKDDANYQKFATDYKNSHDGEEYNHLDRVGNKSYEWQPRVKQEIIQRSVTLNFDRPNYTGEEGNKATLSSVPYQGGAIAYTAMVTDLAPGDAAVSATLEYYEAVDDNYNLNTATKISAAIDVGYYIIHPVELSNANYKIDDSVQDVKLEIKKRNTIIKLNRDMSIVNDRDKYLVNLNYNGNSQVIKYGADRNAMSDADMKSNDFAFFVYNVEEVDLGMIQVDIRPMDENDASYNAIDVPQKNEDGSYPGSYQVIISFADGDAAANYALPTITRFVVTIVPADVDFQAPDEIREDYTYGERDLDVTYFAYGKDSFGIPSVEPKYVRYYKFDDETGDWDDPYAEDEWEEIKVGEESSARKPENAGRYKVVYMISNDDNGNYNTTVSPEYEINIERRNVQFHARDLGEYEFTYGKEFKDIGAGYFETFTATGGKNTGLLVDHALNNDIVYRYQYIGEPMKPGAATPSYRTLTMNEVMTGNNTTSTIWDIGCYVVYPVLLLDCNDPSHAHHDSGQKVYDPVRCSNYRFTLETQVINVQKLTVEIKLNDIDKEYSKPVEFDSFNANATKRAWEYSGRTRFVESDDIVITLTTDALASSEVGSEWPITVSQKSGKPGVAGHPELDKSNNYNIVVKNENEQSYLTVVPLTVNIRTFTDKASVIYGEELPKFDWHYDGDNEFMNWHYDDNNQCLVGDNADNIYPTFVFHKDGEEVQVKDAGIYELGVRFDLDENGEVNPRSGNYEIVFIPAIFEITAREITIDTFSVEDGGRFMYDGMAHHPKTEITFKDKSGEKGILDEDKGNITVAYIFTDKDGNELEEIKNVGIYTAVIDETRILNAADGSLNNNYVLVMDEGDTEYDSATIEIYKRTIVINVNDATRIFRIRDSLSAVNSHGSMNKADYRNYLAEGEAPYSYADGSFRFVDEVIGTLKIDQFYEEALDNIKPDVVEIEFSGEFFDAENYDITINRGNLLVIPADFDELEGMLFVAYNGQRVERDGHEGGIKLTYTGENFFDGLKLYTSNNNTAIRDAMSFSYVNEEDEDVNGEIVNAGVYYMVITPSGDESPFTGEMRIPFVVNKAVRNISESDIVKEVHYNKLVFKSSVPGLQYSINKQAFISADGDTFVYDEGVVPSQNYYIEVKVKDGIDPNYYDSNVLGFVVVTGINAQDLADKLNALQSVTFSNLAVYRALKDQIGNVQADDMYLIDSNHVAALDASYDKLLSDATAVISGAQSVAAKAVGKSNNSTAATAMALSSASLGVGALGLMLGIIAKKRKEEEMEEVSPKAKKVNGKKYAKRFAIVIAIMLVAVMVFAGCKNNSMKQDELLNLASYKIESNEKSRDYEITVSQGSTIVYRNNNGVETVNENIKDAPHFELGAVGVGLDFNEGYFENISYVTSKSTATFSADVKDVSSFLGISNATNASVNVIANIDPKRLSSIEIEYTVGAYKVQIITTLVY